MEEALRAKNGLHAKLFNDPRISITFSRNEHAPNHYFTGTRGPMPPFHVPQFDGMPQPIAPSSFHGRGIPGFGGTEPTFSAAIGDLNWRSSPSNQMLSSPSASMNPLTKSTPGSFNVFDASQIQREPKRLRTDGPHFNNGFPSNTRFTNGNLNTHHADMSYMWRGVLAKGGTPVCRARCVPIGDWIGYEMPEVVNCSARTGLDMLAKHYADAIGFDIVFFLPDSEEDFASYTEFLQYMGDRNRAGVVKFGDGTTLFLVPPSDFLTTVLKVSGPPRLYGVVLKFQPNASDNLSVPPISQGHVNSVPPVTVPSTTPSTTPLGLSLTPELVATLASLAKTNSNGQQPLENALSGPLLNGLSHIQGHVFEHETSNITGDFMQSNKANDPNLAVTKSSYIQNPSFHLPHNQEVASVTNSSFQTPQGVEFALPVQVSQQHQVDYPYDSHTAGNAATLPSQVYNTNAYESQSMVPGQQKLEYDAEKHELYQSTLQFAANLLLQIQQKRSETETNGNS